MNKKYILGLKNTYTIHNSDGWDELSGYGTFDTLEKARIAAQDKSSRNYVVAIFYADSFDDFYPAPLRPICVYILGFEYLYSKSNSSIETYDNAEDKNRQRIMDEEFELLHFEDERT